MSQAEFDTLHELSLGIIATLFHSLYTSNTVENIALHVAPELVTISQLRSDSFCLLPSPLNPFSKPHKIHRSHYSQNVLILGKLEQTFKEIQIENGEKEK